MNKLKLLIAYASWSSSTQEVAELIEVELLANGIHSENYRIGSGVTPDLSKFDIILIGTFTWIEGSVPEEVKDFIYDVGYKPDKVYIFGTGDTQFGGEKLFCMAAKKLAKFYNSKLEPLKIEQSPRGSQETIVKEWIEKVMKMEGVVINE